MSFSDCQQPYRYQVGGSLKANAPSYVKRSADDLLFDRLLAGEFCYVFNSRQMGKSSLRNHVTQRLIEAGVCCLSVDLTTFGSSGVTEREWYQALIKTLHDAPATNLAQQVDLSAWLQENHYLPPVNLFSCYLQDVLLHHVVDHQIVILIDEIDYALSLSFDTDDLFALIRACFNLRSENPAYDRLTFSIFGVATPAGLIADPVKTPFNIGIEVGLQGFKISESTALLAGLVDCGPQPEEVLQEILAWTGGQPFLTQKLCQILQFGNYELPELGTGAVASWVESLVRSHIIDNWQSQDRPKHLESIQAIVLRDESKVSRMLGLYQQILTAGEIVADNSELESAKFL